MCPTLLSRIHRSLLGFSNLAGSWQQQAHLNFQLPLKQCKIVQLLLNNDKHLGPSRIEWRSLVSITLQDAQTRIPYCFGTVKKA